MGHDIDIIYKDGELIKTTYITSNFSKYKNKYPGIHAIHGNNNDKVTEILKSSINLLLKDGITPCIHNGGFGDKDPIKDLECYAACLKNFLEIAVSISEQYKHCENIYWYSDQC
jgi:hypothetical protein